MKINDYHLGTAGHGLMVDLRPRGPPSCPTAWFTTESKPPRGCFAVDHQGSRFFYRCPYNTTVREIRAAIDFAFSGTNLRKVRGRYPIYNIEETR